MNKLKILFFSIIIGLIAAVITTMAWTNPSANPPGGTSAALYYYDGNVGIGTVGIPGAKLDVNGTIQMTGLKIPTGASSGYVLTSDASGVGTWQASTGGGGVQNTASRAFRNTVLQYISPRTWNKVEFNAESYDQGNNFDSTTNYRYVVPSSGRYLINSVVSIGSQNGREFMLYLKVNGIWRSFVRVLAGESYAISMPFTDIQNLFAGDYLEMFIYHTSDSNQTIEGSTGGDHSWMSVHKLADGSSSDSDWIISGSNMYSGVSGNVGIGTTNPSSAKLQVDLSGCQECTAIKMGDYAAGGRQYFQIDVENSDPPPSSCNEDSERGRMVLRGDSGTFFLCANFGWKTL